MLLVRTDIRHITLRTTMATDNSGNALAGSSTSQDIEGVDELCQFLQAWSLPGPANSQTIAEQQDALDRQRLDRSRNPPRWAIGRRVDNQNVLDNFDPRLEMWATGSFLSSSGNFAGLPKILISRQYPVSYMFMDTLVAFGYQPICRRIRVSVNPRGGVFRPIGIQTMYMWLEGFQGNTPFYINFLVLPGSPNNANVFFFFGGPDIDRLFGADWTPARRLGF